MFFITGASGSGKSASLPGLRAALPTIDWRDFDEFGVPSPCPRGWRPRTTERWIQVALKNKQRGRDTGVVGGAIMGEILACPSASHIGEIHVVLLDCHDVVRLDRLRRRDTHGATQDMLSWAVWQRVHAVDPQWRQDVICSVQIDTMRWERRTAWQRDDPRWRVDVLDTTILRLIRWWTESLLGFRRSNNGRVHRRPAPRPHRDVSLGTANYSGNPAFHGLRIFLDIFRSAKRGLAV